jgi:PTS system mannose-specific IID component
MEVQKEQGSLSIDTIRDFKRGAMIAFAAMGDALFWRTLRPLCAAAAIALALGDHLWAPLLFLVSYNPAHLLIRIYGLRLARQDGIRMIENINRWNLPKRVVQLRHGLPVVLGALSAKCALAAPDEFELVMPILALPFVIVASNLIQKRVSIPIILASTFVLLTAAIWFFPSE